MVKREAQFFLEQISKAYLWEVHNGRSRRRDLARGELLTIMVD
jgi:hypothetical protein